MNEDLGKKLKMDDRQHADLANNIRDAIEPMLQLARDGRRVDLSRIRGLVTEQIGIWRKEFDSDFSPDYKHVKRGTVYDLMCEDAIFQGDFVNDNDVLCIYMGENGQIWVRLKEEFHDGRFEEIKQ